MKLCTLLMPIKIDTFTAGAEKATAVENSTKKWFAFAKLLHIYTVYHLADGSLYFYRALLLYIDKIKIKPSLCHEMIENPFVRFCVYECVTSLHKIKRYWVSLNLCE